jgi:pyruvate formate lyase activating enzyme
MKIAYWHKCSFVDYPGQVAATLFTPGCNMRCHYCNIRSTLVDQPEKEPVPIESVLSFLEKRRGLINGVVITGGEPTLQKGLEAFLRKVRKLRYSIKLDTNGSNPEKLAALIRNGLVDYVALDLKAPPEKLRQVTGVDISPELIEQSKKLIMDSYIDYEYRTTLLPDFSIDDIITIGLSIVGARRYVLQQYREPEQSIRSSNTTPHSPAFFLELESQMRGWFEELVLRDIGFGRYPAPRLATDKNRRARAVGE